MDLRTPMPYWLLKNGLAFSYPTLEEDLAVDYAVIGGGISGALVAWHLAEAGVSAVVLDRRHIGMGSTCASTAMLQYEIDTPMEELAARYGETAAAQSYWQCARAITALRDLCAKVPSAQFEPKPSLYVASRPRHVAALKREFALRKRHGFEVEFLDQATIRQMFGFAAPAAIYSRQGAQVDAYALTHGLLQLARAKGTRVFDKTDVKGIEHAPDGVVLHTEHGHRVRAKYVVMAGGYESLAHLRTPVAALHSSYALVSKPLADPGGFREAWHERALIWETDRPYLYMRTTADGRVLVGGRDTPFRSPLLRDRLLARKTEQLAADFALRFPDLSPLRVDYAWAGTFAETPDGLPYIGDVPYHPRITFALGFGGNGITFSQIAAEIIAAAAHGRSHEAAALFSFARLGGTLA